MNETRHNERATRVSAFTPAEVPPTRLQEPSKFNFPTAANSSPSPRALAASTDVVRKSAPQLGMLSTSRHSSMASQSCSAMHYFWPERGHVPSGYLALGAKLFRNAGAAFGNFPPRIHRWLCIRMCNLSLGPHLGHPALSSFAVGPSVLRSGAGEDLRYGLCFLQVRSLERGACCSMPVFGLSRTGFGSEDL